MIIATLTPAQKRCLLRKLLTGDFPPRQPGTISALVRLGLLEVRDRRYFVSDAGRRYCDEHHLDM